MMMENTSSARCRALAMCATDAGWYQAYKIIDLVLLAYKMFVA